MDIGQRIKIFRKQYGYTALELAEALQVSQSHISRLENGTRLPSIDFLMEFCDFLNITLGEFFYDGLSDLPDDIQQLLTEAKSLTPEKRDLIIKLIQAMR
ncbi:helix-turn-helix domain-containing protein [Fodinisporobacter ferrooxydans]|uniref:Helix-turn-helix domain-containing protein n=1 Tax=Fodinisporobacter ferrooxydans TaxID=2901836 RepID=A0ABY4CJZ4_9BACL|nr:helix-turn-helix domain-containing protein [Alicyclobacillaceae bacterium MYW30-H2]